MIKFLPFIVITILILAGVGISLNFQPGNQSLEKTPKGPASEDRLRSLENTVARLTTQLDLQAVQPESSKSSDLRIKNLEAAVSSLKARVAKLEKTGQAAGAGSKSPLYIPLGGGGGPWNDQDWHALNEYQVTINPDSYNGYSSMQLEVNFRLAEAAGTAYARLYNVTDNSAVSAEVSTTGTAFGTQTSGTFKLPSGQKTYTLQIKSSANIQLFVQSARIKVNF